MRGIVAGADLDDQRASWGPTPPGVPPVERNWRGTAARTQDGAGKLVGDHRLDPTGPGERRMMPLPGRRERSTPPEPAPFTAGRARHRNRCVISGAHHEAFARRLEHFHDCATGVSERPVTDGEQALADMRLMTAIIRACLDDRAS